MAETKDQLVDEDAMDKMSVAPPDPSPNASGPSGPSVSDRQQAAAGEGGLDVNQTPDASPANESGVADEDPLSAHPT